MSQSKNYVKTNIVTFMIILSSLFNDSGDTERVLANCPIPQKWKSYPARELNPGSPAIAAVALTTELLSWDSY